MDRREFVVGTESFTGFSPWSPPVFDLYQWYFSMFLQCYISSFDHNLKISMNIVLVENFFKYFTPFWTPFSPKYIDRIQMVPKKFTMAVNYGHNHMLLGVDYNVCLRQQEMMSNKKGFFLVKFFFTRRSINISTIPWSNYFSFNLPSHRGRRYSLFSIPKARISVCNYSVFERMMYLQILKKN